MIPEPSPSACEEAHRPDGAAEHGAPHEQRSSERRALRRARVFGSLLLLTAVYFVAAKVGLKLASVHVSASPVWPPTGIALASLLLFGYRCWPAIFAGAFLANVTTAGSAATCVGIATGNTLEGLLGAYLVNTAAGGRNVFDRPADVVRFAAIGVFSTSVSATFGVSSLCAGGGAPWVGFGPIWWTWWLGDLGGHLVVAPLLILWSSKPARRWNTSTALEAAGLLLSLFLVTKWVFGGQLFLPAKDYDLTFLCVPLMFWAAYRFEQHGAATAVFLAAALALWGTLSGSGPFARVGQNQTLLLIQTFMGVLSVTSLALGSSVAERRRVAQVLRSAYEDLGMRFQREQAGLGRAMEALRAEISAHRTAERHARIVTETLRQPLLVMDAQLRVKAANRAFYRTFHLSKQNTENRSLFEIGNGEWAIPRLGELLEVMLSRRTTIEGLEGLELAHEFPRVGRRILVLNARWVERENGNDELIVLAIEDATDRKEAEAALRGSEARFRAVAETAIEGIICANRHGEIVYANGAAARLFGYSVDQVTGHPLIGLMPERFHEDHRRGFEHYLGTGESSLLGKTVELAGRRRDGSEFPLELSLASWGMGEEVWFAGLIRDISERKAAERAILRLNAELEERVRTRTRELQRSNLELERFAYVAAHDLQEPLRTVTGYAQLLSKRYSAKLAPAADEMIATIVDGAGWMHDLINDLLAYSRLGTASMSLGPVDCEEVLDRVLRNLGGRILEKGARVTRDPLPQVVADELQLVQVFQNLIGNAIKFRGGQPPQVHVSARRAEPNWQFSIRDNGIGIAPADVERIFGVFQRLHTREEYPGTGIGLAICNRIIERHGGRIWASSEPGGGSTFFFELPEPAAAAVAIPRGLFDMMSGPVRAAQ